MVIIALTALWIAVAFFGGNAITYVNGMLVMMLYFLMPWTAVNLIDYFFLRRGRYSIPDLFQPDGLYGSWGIRGLVAYAVGFLVSVPFFVVPNVYTGPIAGAPRRRRHRLARERRGRLRGLTCCSAGASIWPMKRWRWPRANASSPSMISTPRPTLTSPR